MTLLLPRTVAWDRTRIAEQLSDCDHWGPMSKRGMQESMKVPAVLWPFAIPETHTDDGTNSLGFAHRFVLSGCFG